MASGTLQKAATRKVKGLEKRIEVGWLPWDCCCACVSPVDPGISCLLV